MILCSNLKKLVKKVFLTSFILLTIACAKHNNLMMHDYEIKLADGSLLGDVNSDGKVNATDYILVRKHILNMSLLNSSNIKKADVNNDGKINSADYIAIRKIIINKVNTPISDVKVSSVSLNKTSVTLKNGDSINLAATISPSNATNKNVIWASDNTNVATVNKNGKVTIINPGEAVITVTTLDGNKTASCKIVAYDYYDIVLLWGQSNTTDNTKLLKGIDSDIIAHNVSYSRVTVDIPKDVAYEYLGLSNKLVDVSTNPKKFGEVAYYENGKLVSKTNNSENVQIYESTGTNMIPYFAKEYYEKTKHKVIFVLAASSGKPIHYFVPGYPTNLYNVMITKYKMAEKYITGNKYNKIVNRFYVVYQGETNVRVRDGYKENYQNIHKSLLKDLNLSFGAMVYMGVGTFEPNDSDLLKFREIQRQLVSESNTLIKGTDYVYEQLSKGNKSILCVKGNDIHLNSAGLSQVGRDIARTIYNSNLLK